MKDVFDKINNKPIYWTDSKGTTHAVEGADVHPGVRLLWTKCERDVPANEGFQGAFTVTCERCKQP